MPRYLGRYLGPEAVPGYMGQKRLEERTKRFIEATSARSFQHRGGELVECLIRMERFAQVKLCVGK